MEARKDPKTTFFAFSLKKKILETLVLREEAKAAFWTRDFEYQELLKKSSISVQKAALQAEKLLLVEAEDPPKLVEELKRKAPEELKKSEPSPKEQKKEEQEQKKSKNERRRAKLKAALTLLKQKEEQGKRTANPELAAKDKGLLIRGPETALNAKAEMAAEEEK